MTGLIPAPAPGEPLHSRVLPNAPTRFVRARVPADGDSGSAAYLAALAADVAGYLAEPSPAVVVIAVWRRCDVATVAGVDDVRYFWHEAEVPAGLEITQVYGYLLCPQTARVLVQDDEGSFNLPGGTPEQWDEDIVATLVREAFEENQVRVTGAVYLGYQEVHRPARAPYAQVRMAALIDAFEPRRPDPDGGRVYRRLMTSLAEAPQVLGWGEPAVAQAKATARVAEELWELPVTSPAPPGYVD